MPSLFTQGVRSRWLALVVHIGLWLLIYLAIRDIGGRTPPFRDANAFSAHPQPVAPVGQLDPLFSPAQWLREVAVSNAVPAGTNASGTSTGAASSVKSTAYLRLIDTNFNNPFFTRHFVPPPTPAPPPPPTTRKVKITYQGFYQGHQTPKHAILKIGDNFVIAKVGALIETNLFIAEAALQTLTVTNLAAQTNVIPLNATKEIEVPLK